ncbi:MAG TPA: hypothetical protein VFS58_12065 [Steroidobacteraceae bacterium]|nr:hypothetical protein [Steroidobacteraceae bacterium]
MYKKVLGVATVCVLWVTAVSAQTPNVTVQLRDGSRVEGRIEEMTADGTVFVRVSQHDQRRIPISTIALIDRVGGARGLPETELREAVGPAHLLLMSSGGSVKGQLVAIRGGQGSAQEGQARTFVFRNQDGREQEFSMGQVSRVYLGTYPIAAITGGTVAADLDPGVAVPGAIRVPAKAGWVSTGMRVRRGEVVTFNTSGQVQLSDNANDRARSAGTPRNAAGAPIPNIYAGALIGRVGTGQSFAIGDQASVPMPNEGLLYLAVNDDELGDNAGEFVVQLGRR